MHCCQIKRNFRYTEYLCKLRKEYLMHGHATFILSSRQNLQNFRQNLQNFDISHAFLSLTVAKLSTLKNSPFFGPPCICVCIIGNIQGTLATPAV